LINSYRQAQATVLEAIPRLKAEKVSTKRPDDYYAQMVKTDEHMKRV
jgi:rRNA-processing protein EBP2